MTTSTSRNSPVAAKVFCWFCTYTQLNGTKTSRNRIEKERRKKKRTKFDWMLCVIVVKRTHQTNVNVFAKLLTHDSSRRFGIFATSGNRIEISFRSICRWIWSSRMRWCALRRYSTVKGMLENPRFFGGRFSSACDLRQMYRQMFHKYKQFIRFVATGSLHVFNERQVVAPK